MCLVCNHFRLESLWLSNEILPIISGMLPRLPKMRTVARVRSSCDTSFLLADKTSTVDAPASTMSGMETYEHRDDLWAEMEEIETESKFNLQGVDAKSSDSNDHNERDQQ